MIWSWLNRHPLLLDFSLVGLLLVLGIGAAIRNGHADATGIALSIAANRLSYFFDFRGPSIVVDTACSSSLVAVDLACQNLLARRCTTALPRTSLRRSSRPRPSVLSRHCASASAPPARRTGPWPSRRRTPGIARGGPGSAGSDRQSGRGNSRCRQSVPAVPGHRARRPDSRRPCPRPQAQAGLRPCLHA